MKFKRKETQEEKVRRTSQWRKVFIVSPICIDRVFYFLQYVEERWVWSISGQVLCHKEYRLIEAS